MNSSKRWVVDTNALINRLVLPSSTTAKAVNLALQTGDFLVSSETLTELSEVLAQPKFDRYLSSTERITF